MAAVRRRVDHPGDAVEAQITLPFQRSPCSREGGSSGSRSGSRPITASTAAASSSVAWPAVAGQLEVGQHAPGRVELRPGRCRPVRQRQPADEPVLARGRTPGRRRRGWRPAPGRTRRPRRSWSCRARPSAGSGTPGRRRAPRARRPRRPPPASAVRAPRRRRSPRGRAGCVFISAVVPSLSRIRVAVEMSPPATGAVATTDGAEELLGALGDQRQAGHRRACSACNATTIASVVRSTMREDLLEPVVVHRSTGPARPTRSRRGRSRGTSAPGRRGPPMSARLVASMASSRSYGGPPAVVVLAGAVPAGVVPGGGQGGGGPLGPSGCRRASRRCRCWTPRPGRRGRPPPSFASSTTAPSASGRCCRGRRRRPSSGPGSRGGGRADPSHGCLDRLPRGRRRSR